MSQFYILVALLCCVVTQLAFGKTIAVESKALDKLITQGASSCSTRGTISLPVITWGGDINTIHANGNQLITAKDSIFAQRGLKIELFREDVFANQVRDYLNCRSPFLRGTMGMINMASAVTDKDPRTRLKVIYQLTWSAGGDALVVKSAIKQPKDLKGKTIALQAYGPHVDYLGKLLADTGLSVRDVNIKWVKDLTGTDQSPMAALYESGVDAAMVIIPDALALTSGGTVGSGAEDSVRGARILLSTKSANRIIADVYAVRSDYFEANKAQVQQLVAGLIESQQALRQLVKEKKTRRSEYDELISSSAKILLDSEQATGDTEGMYADAQFTGFRDNKRFFTDSAYPRRFAQLNREIQSTLIDSQLLSQARPLAAAGWDFDVLMQGQSVEAAGLDSASRFNQEAVAQLVTRRRQQGVLDDGSLFHFEVFFKPNQNSFSADLYADDFVKVIDLASTYGGAVITVEGHSDPLGYLKKKKAGSTDVVLRRIKQAAKNLSLSRANAVRDSLIQYAVQTGVSLDPSQFAVVGMGIEQPASGRCGDDPCAPKTSEEWLGNMRVQFRIIQVEAEETVFQPL